MGDVVRLHRREPQPLWRELVGRELRAQREARRERLVDVADVAGVSAQYLSEIERGLKDPSSEVLAAVAEALGLGVLDLTRRVSATVPVPVQARPTGPVCLAA